MSPHPILTNEPPETSREMPQPNEDGTEDNQSTASFTTLPAEIRQQIIFYVMLARDTKGTYTWSRRELLRESIFELSHVAPQWHADLSPVVIMLIQQYTAIRARCMRVEAQTDWARKGRNTSKVVLQRWAYARKTRDGIDGCLRTLAHWQRRVKRNGMS